MTAGVDAHGTVTACGSRTPHLLGYSPAEVVGRSVADLLAAPLPRPARCRLADGRSWSGTAVLCHRDGHGLEVWLHAQPLPARDGTVTQWFVTAVTVQDLRDHQRERQAELTLLDWAFTQAPIGLAIFDTEVRVRRLNSESAHMTGLRERDARGRPAAEVFPAPGQHQPAGLVEQARQVVRTGEPAYYEAYEDYRAHGADGADGAFHQAPGEPRERAWAITLSPVRDPAGQVRGLLSASLDISERYWARQRLTLLNEANAAIGSTLELTRTAQELADIAVPRFADWASVDLLDTVYHGDEPPPGPITTPVMLRRTAHQSALMGQPEAVVALGQTDIYPPDSPIATVLATGRSASYRISDPPMARWMAASPLRAARIREYGLHSVMIVPLRARGSTLGVAVFIRHQHHPGPFTPDDLVLADELGARTAVCLDNARRYTRERTTALTLQHSLLPHHLPRHTAVDVASRYLPAGAQAGVGGDWYDVIPLSGARVALVVGDVTDHGIHAAATMGQLRTAVRTLADADPTPDELLTRLDDVITRLATGSSQNAD
ncbi:SpoIIE family protein phosphatase, partial [Frankia sp. CiP1_Cm_nod2]|uniref:SpoIIE family protein phosphatase n=1 Tax=Frankia sp. CiP1_Cm_nod2 TaxID=2897161 RepID=UPI004043CC7A